jgi:hypothetical protein
MMIPRHAGFKQVFPALLIKAYLSWEFQSNHLDIVHQEI